MVQFTYIKAQTRFHFAWLERPERLSQSIREMPHVKFGVIFSISCDVPFHTMCLAYMLLRFRDENIRMGDYHIFRLQSLCFRYTEHGIYGVMLFDRPFKWAYLSARTQGFLESNGFYLIKNTVFSRWISTSAGGGNDARLTEENARDLLVKGR